MKVNLAGVRLVLFPGALRQHYLKNKSKSQRSDKGDMYLKIIYRYFCFSSYKLKLLVLIKITSKGQF